MLKLSSAISHGILLLLISLSTQYGVCQDAANYASNVNALRGPSQSVAPGLQHPLPPVPVVPPGIQYPLPTGANPSPGLKYPLPNNTNPSSVLPLPSPPGQHVWSGLNQPHQAFPRGQQVSPGPHQSLPPGVDVSHSMQQPLTPGGSVAGLLDNATVQLEEQSAQISCLNCAFQRKVEPGHKCGTMKIFGRVHADVWGFPGSDVGVGFMEGGPTVIGGDPIGPQDRMGLRRLRLGATGHLILNMEYFVELELADQIRTEFRDAWIGWNNLPFLQTLRIGNQKRPIGLDHWNSSNFNIFMERPFVIEANNREARRIGVQSWNSSANERWSWQYGLFNQRVLEDEAFYISDHWQLQAAGRLANTLWFDESSGGRRYGHWAISGAWGDVGGPQIDVPLTGPAVSEARWQTRPEAFSTNPWIDTGVIDGANDAKTIGLEGLVNFGPVQVASEYQSVFVTRDSGQSDLRFHGGYLYLAYFLTGENMSWDRRTNQLARMIPCRSFFRFRSMDGKILKGPGAWQIAVRFSYGDYSDDDINGGVGKSVTAGLNWHWTPYARMQFNYIHGRIDNTWSRGLLVAPNQPLQSGSYDIIGTRVMADF